MERRLLHTWEMGELERNKLGLEVVKRKKREHVLVTSVPLTLKLDD